MTDTSESGREDAGLTRHGVTMTVPDLSAWFAREVLPLEAALTQFLHRNWRNSAEVVDLRQDVYVRICEIAQKKLPDPVRPLLFSIARGLLVDRVRKRNVVPIEAVSDLDALGIAVEPLSSGPQRCGAGRNTTTADCDGSSASTLPRGRSARPSRRTDRSRNRGSDGYHRTSRQQSSQQRRPAACRHALRRPR